MADTDSPQSTGKNFFSTLPGIITGLAALITAVGGFILILSKTGCLNTNNLSKKDIEQNDTLVNQNKETKDTIVNNNWQSKVSYSPAEIKHATRYITYKIKEANSETLPDRGIVLHLKIKCVNDSKYEYNFYSSYIRVMMGEDKYASDPYSPSGNYQAVDANSFKDLEYNFKLPAGAQKFNLVFYDEKDEIGSFSFTIK